MTNSRYSIKNTPYLSKGFWASASLTQKADALLVKTIPYRLTRRCLDPCIFCGSALVPGRIAHYMTGGAGHAECVQANKSPEAPPEAPPEPQPKLDFHPHSPNDSARLLAIESDLTTVLSEIDRLSGKVDRLLKLWESPKE